MRLLGTPLVGRPKGPREGRYFNSLLSRWLNSNAQMESDETIRPYFIDRSFVIFEHVLSLLRDPSYPFPADHCGELDFYGIDYDKDSLKANDRFSSLEYKIDQLYISSNIKRKCAISLCTDDAVHGSNYCKRCKICDGIGTFQIKSSYLVKYKGSLYYCNLTEDIIYLNVDTFYRPNESLMLIEKKEWRKIKRPTREDIEMWLGTV
jgi:hypothetical protein